MGQLSPDGHWRWDGWRWVPARPVAPGHTLPRRPTVWTHRLQVLLLVVAGWGLLSGLISAALFPHEWSQMEAAIVAQWRAQGVSPTERRVLQSYLSAALPVALVFIILWSLGVCALQVAGTLRRWVWWYWVQFAICCLAAVSLVVTLVEMLLLLATPSGSGPPSVTVYRAEALTIPLTLVGDLLCVGAGICMLIAAIQIGPWAMMRTPVREA